MIKLFWILQNLVVAPCKGYDIIVTLIGFYRFKILNHNPNAYPDPNT